MALEYHLILSTECSMPVLMESVRQHSGFAWNADQTFLAGTGGQVSGIVCGRSQKETFEENFGFRPEAVLYFRLASGTEERRQGYCDMLKAVDSLLQKVAGQAVLLFNGETILLQWLGTELLLNSDWQTWQKEGQELMTLPHTMRSLPSPLL